VLGQLPNAKVKAFVIWTPIMPADKRSDAVAATGYLSESRAEHFWDLWTFVSKIYTEQLRYPPQEVAWDMLVFYKPHLLWRSGPPEPSLWLENRDLPIGTKWDIKVLRAELEKWIN
jgi:hypothetical protein